MKFNVGDIVKGEKNESLVILATKEFALTAKNLKKLNGTLYIKDVEIFARTEICVVQGFDYVVGEIQSFDGKYCILENQFNFTNVFEEELAR